MWCVCSCGVCVHEYVCVLIEVVLCVDICKSVVLIVMIKVTHFFKIQENCLPASDFIIIT